MFTEKSTIRSASKRSVREGFLSNIWVLDLLFLRIYWLCQGCGWMKISYLTSMRERFCKEVNAWSPCLRWPSPTSEISRQLFMWENRRSTGFLTSKSWERGAVIKRSAEVLGSSMSPQCPWLCIHYSIDNLLMRRVNLLTQPSSERGIVKNGASEDLLANISIQHLSYVCSYSVSSQKQVEILVKIEFKML